MRALWVTAWESQREMLPQATAQSSVCPRIKHNDGPVCLQAARWLQLRQSMDLELYERIIIQETDFNEDFDIRKNKKTKRS